jgi:hypothetical protein
MMQVISKNQGLTGGYLDATQHIMAALPRLLSIEELGSVRVQMAQMADTARRKQQQVLVLKN